MPFFGICLGMQCAVIEYARHVLGLEEAHTSEHSPDTENLVISLMDDQEGVPLGGTMRLGAYACDLRPGTLAADLTARTTWTSGTAIATSSTTASATSSRRRR